MIQIGDKEFATLVDYMRSNFGINLIKKRTLIESRLNNYLTADGFDNYKTFLKHMFEDKTGKVLSEVLNRLTTNYSYFMREWDHFALFTDRVLPELASSVKDKDLRIWSAGCSTGQEPYTLAMLTSDYFADQRTNWDAQVLATDISQKALEAAVRGRFDSESLKNVPASWKLSYFTKFSEDQWEVSPAIKKEVIFRRFNLIEQRFPFKKKFHVIFCRNVMIYFNEQTKRELVEKFYEATADGGYLFVGQSETLDKTKIQYKSIIPSVYKKGE